MKKYIILSLALSIGISCYGQSKDQNYIHTRTYTSSDAEKYTDQVQYFDGLGRPVQTVQIGISPNKEDLVTLQEYDSFGRDSKTWLPVISNTNGTYTTPSEIIRKSIDIYNDSAPFAKPVYENSPLDRVVEQYAPGEDWQTKGKAVKTQYLTNVDGDDSLNCILYEALGTNQEPSLKKSSRNNYATGELFVTRIEDENGNASYEFKDKLGQVVLTRQINNGERHDTYYVYNDFGNLCFVLPPRIDNEGTTQAKLDELAYQYKYDNRNRCIWKKLPGSEPIYYIYDKADQLIFSQDGENRSKGEWAFSIPDAFGRVVLSGVCKDTISVSNKVVKGVYSSAGSYNRYNIQVDDEDKKFTNSPFIHSVNFYDNYDFRGMTEIPVSGTEYTPEFGYGEQYNLGKGYEAKGLLTGTITKDLNTDKSLYSVMYYDNRGRLIQTKSNNYTDNGLEKEYIAYNFVGQPTVKKHIQTAVMNGKQVETIELYSYAYDHAGRLTETRQKLDSSKAVKVIKNNYDELGRLQSTSSNIYK